MLKIASRARSLVGRTRSPGGAASLLPRCLPAMIRMRRCRGAPAPGPRIAGPRRATGAELLGQHLSRYLLDRAARQRAKLEGTIGETDETGDGISQMLEHPPDLAVAPFAQADLEPSVAALLAVKHGANGAVIGALDADAVGERLQPRPIDDAVNAHLVAPEPAGRRQFEAPRQPAVIGEQQQALGIEVEAPYRDDARQSLRQPIEDRLAPLLVASRRHQPGR